MLYPTVPGSVGVFALRVVGVAHEAMAAFLRFMAHPAGSKNRPRPLLQFLIQHVHPGVQRRWSAAEALAWIISRQTKFLTQEMGKELRNAEACLAGAIVQQWLHAWGRPDTRGGLYEQIPAELFSIPDHPLVIDVCGELVPFHRNRPWNGRKYYQTEFAPEEIMRVWPKPPPPAPIDWMREQAAQLQLAGKALPKRASLVADCMKATACTWREACRAYKTLPDDMRRGQGRPRKADGATR
jgi:hypothetical protein